MTDSTALASLAGDEVLLATKLYLPPPRPRAVLRPHLIERLSHGLALGRQVTVISAPPGSGKSSLLAEWLAGLRRDGSRAVAWLSLDSRDNEPRRLFVYCIAALQTVRPGIGQRVLDFLRSHPLGTANPQTLLTMLINEMAELPRPLVFGLDDYHLIETETVHPALAFLLDNLPPQVHMVIASRRGLPLSLARLRARGAVTELSGIDLRFTAAESAQFLRQTMGLTLTAAEIALLEERTEGWIAGLQLAALSLHGREDAAGFVKEFSGSHRYVLDYLLAEVLQRQPAGVQNFLQQTSILERLSGPLCDALLANGQPPNSQAVLEQLEQANLFVVPLDDRRRWYRYHHLFADLLRERQHQTASPAVLVRLHTLASDWFEQNGLPAEAMHHALAAGDAPRILRLARQNASPLLSQGELVTLLSWLDALPESRVRSRSGISLLQAWAMVLTGRLEAVEPYLRQAEQESAEAGEVAALRATVAYFRRDMAQAVRLYRQALDHLPADSYLRGCVVQSLGAAHSWQGQVRAASLAFAEASTISRETGNLAVHLVAQWTLGLLHAEQGHLRQAEAIFRQALGLAGESPAAGQPGLLVFAGRLHVGLAEILLEQNQLEAARRQLAAGLALGEQTGEAGTLSGGYLTRARLALADGDLNGALAAVEQAGLHAGPFYLSTQVPAYRARLWLAQGNLRAALEWLADSGLPVNSLPAELPYQHEEEYLLLARLSLADSEAVEVGLKLQQPALAVARAALNRIETAARAAGRGGRLLESLLLRALVAQADGQLDAAVDLLAEVLALAEPEGYVRLFLDEGQPMLSLLRRAAAKNVARDTVALLLTAAGQALPGVESELLLDPLSERELEILQLIAAGQSNKELAERLVLTVGTVKWHLNNIYSKLNVRSRTQAIARARELGLIE